MQVTVHKTRQNEDDQTVFMEITYKDNTYRWHADIPFDADPQEYCKQNLERFICDIHRKLYPEAPHMTTLEEWEEWIKGGCKVEVQAGVDEDGNPVIETKSLEARPFKHTWSIT